MFFFKVNVPVGVTPEGLCVYWRPGESLIWETRGCSLVASESDINKTTCECDHLTTFASLMDPYAPTVSEFGIDVLSSHYRGIHADVIVYICAHLLIFHTALLTEISMLDMN